MLTPLSGAEERRDPMPFDIMMPFYGRIDHFRIAVQSVLDQTDRRLATRRHRRPLSRTERWRVAARARRRTDRVRAASANVGINANFQEAIDRSVADWFTIFGCDDALHPGYVRHMRSLAAAFPDAAMLHPGVRIIDEDGELVRTIVDSAKAFYRPRAATPIRLSGERLATSVTRGNWMNFPAVAWHGPRTRAMGFREGYEVVQDLALVLDLCEAGGSLIVDDTVEFDYRRHAGSVSSWKAVDGSRFREERAFFTQLADRFEARGWHKAARSARFHVSSRINALTRIPSALAARDRLGSPHARRPRLRRGPLSTRSTRQPRIRSRGHDLEDAQLAVGGEVELLDRREALAVHLDRFVDEHEVDVLLGERRARVERDEDLVGRRVRDLGLPCHQGSTRRRRGDSTGIRTARPDRPGPTSRRMARPGIH